MIIGTGTPDQCVVFAPSSAWDAVLDWFERADAAHDAACVAYSRAQRLYFDARPAGRDDAACLKRFRVDAAEEAEDQAGEAASAALDAVLTVPAPTIAAVIRKIELARDHGRAIGELAPVIADLRRLGMLAVATP